MLEAGSKAPEFTLQDKDGNNVSSQDMKGKKYVVYFYPKDNTPGCTKQACGFRDAIEEYNVLDIPVIGISKDSVVHTVISQRNTNFHLFYYPIQI